MSVTVKVVKTSICDCGYPTLDESIEIGTKYTIYPETLRPSLVYGCGGCGKIQFKLLGVYGDSILDPDGRPELFPADLFDLTGLIQ